MSDNKVMIVDETQDEEVVLSPEELEEFEREQRLKKIFKRKKNYDTSFWFYLSKVVNVLALVGIMIGMLLEAGEVFAVCLAVILISSIVNYLCFKD